MPHITVTPWFIRTPTARGWVLRISGVPAISRWGGEPKRSPGEAVDVYADYIRAAFPTSTVRFLPASPAQIRRSITPMSPESRATLAAVHELRAKRNWS